MICICWALISLCPSAGAGEATRERPAVRKPFFNAREHQTEYAGPGRELPPETDLKEVLIGYFGPSDPQDPQGGDMWLAAKMAIEEANAAGGFQGKPFRLVSAWSENPWGTGVAQVARIVYQERVWAIVGGIDGPSTHLAEQVVAKARLTLLSPASSDKTVNLANVPWMFSCLPGDHLQVGVLAAHLEARAGQGALAIVSTDDHDSRLFARELRRALTELRRAPRYHFECRRATREMAELAEHVVQSEVDAVVLVAGAGDTARLLRAVRNRGFAGSVFGGPAMGRRRFLEEAAGTAPQEWSAAEGVLFPLLYQPNEKSGGFASIFKSRFGRSPDYAAAHTYDAVQLLVTAIRKSGLNRARIRDAVEELSPWAGTTGTVKWDPLGANTRAVVLGTIRDGHLVPADRCDKKLAASNSR